MDHRPSQTAPPQYIRGDRCGHAGPPPPDRSRVSADKPAQKTQVLLSRLPRSGMGVSPKVILLAKSEISLYRRGMPAQHVGLQTRPPPTVTSPAVLMNGIHRHR